MLHEVIEILEREIENKTNQHEETVQILRDKDSSNIELHSQVETLTEELKKKEELIQILGKNSEESKETNKNDNSDLNKISKKPTLTELIKFYNQQLGKPDSNSNSDYFELDLNLNKSEHQNILKILKDIKLPILYEIYIQNLGDFNEPDIINQFLSEAVTEGTKEFAIISSKLDKDQ